MQHSLFDLEARPLTVIAGVDEAGRGPLAGPVFAAAVILDKDHPIQGVRDSKTLNASHREALAAQIRERALAFSIALATVAEIDALNILQATMLAMRRACAGLTICPELILVDGNQLPSGLACRAQAIVKGDAQVDAISAASILAKTARDAHCLDLHKKYPDYLFAKHKGYATREHLNLLALYGPCPAHRRSFEPVRRLICD